MTWQLIILPAAQKDLDGLPVRDAPAVARELDRLAADPGSTDLKKLKGQQNEWRIRVGSYRVRFTFDRHSGAIRVLRILPRAGAYRK
jgi:mRNA interferase RelE/StbE